ncbi:HupE/UreJ family protein [Nocardia blacklockiae]|uniref:HupE/UreJ family protein n=1 Tax=Nocardia blacklockiae TaxID=480036 RepID=UPI001893F419|nr:HupE/UreJ family protein [Nocardia blacklockiae]MBF6173415.1 HupE/UreJ family protein [Nocardia blacklockiae]
MPGTKILLDVRETAIDAEFAIPAAGLAEASGIDVDSRTRLSAEDSAGLVRYLLEHVRFATPDGIPWTVRIGEMRLDRGTPAATGAYKELVAHAALTPPTGADTRHFVLGYDAVIHKIPTHTALVAVRQGWRVGAGSAAQQVDAGYSARQDNAGNNARENNPGNDAGQTAPGSDARQITMGNEARQADTGNDARQIGIIRMDADSMTVPPLSVNLTDPTAWHVFTEMVTLGAHHILQGTDHLLFLFTLLLPAVLTARSARWHPSHSPRRAVRHILTVTIAFTLGHSTALIASALTRLNLPARPIETLIAATILIGATHAIRPLFPGREPSVAAIFGLIHGLAFAFTLTELQLSTTQLALSLLGFNLGIEAVQLLLVALALPPLLALAITRAQPPLRIGGALLTILAALAWSADRLGYPNPIARTADQAGKLLLPLTITATILAVVILLAQALKQRSPTTATHRPETKETANPVERVQAS